MFAVAGTWKLDDFMREQQQRMLPKLVEGVKQNPGFVRGFWADDIDEPDQGVTFVVFETLDQAREFHDAVRANAPAQSEAGVERGQLRIVEIQADA